MLFAYYEVLDPKPSINEFYEMNVAVFLPSFQKLAGVVNANKPLLLRLRHLAFVMTAKSKDNNSPNQPTGYIMDVEPYSKTEGVRGQSMGTVFAALTAQYIGGIENVVIVSPSHVPFEGTTKDKKRI